MASTISTKAVRDFDFKLFSKEAVNELDEKTRRKFGSALFAVSFVIEEQNAEMAKSLVEDLLTAYRDKRFKQNPTFQVREAFSSAVGMIDKEAFQND